MKKVLSVLLCVVLLFGAVSFSAFAQNDEKEEATTEFVLELDVNERYTDFVEDTDGLIEGEEEKKVLSEGNKTVYIAVLVAALVVSVVILAVSVKRVPKEENIDISGQNKTRKDKEE